MSSAAQAEERSTGEHREVVVVGGGQAGLAMGHHLARRGRDFVILEAGPALGSAWRTRWESLVLFTPRRYSGLPGLPFDGDPDGYPTRSDVVAYLERYAAAFELPLEVDSAVRSLTRVGERFVLDLDDRRLEADQVVVATGPFQAPRLPAFASELAPEVVQMHSAGYRSPADLPAGRVVVVGGGNTGFQLAKELSATHAVHLAVGSRQTPLPQTILGRDLFWWLTRLGLLDKTVDSRIGRRASRREMLIGSSPRELRRRYGVALEPRVVGAAGRTLSLADGRSLQPDAVIWATGYRPDHDWLRLPVLDPGGRVRQRRGVTDVAGLYFLGLSWQHTRGSALIGWVGEDADYLAARIESRRRQLTTHEPPEAATAPAPRPTGATEGI